MLAARRGVASLAVVALGTVPMVGARPAPAARMPPATVRTAAPEHPVYFFDERAFATAIADAGPARSIPGVRGIVVPHHWLAGRLIVGSIRDLAASGARITRVILIGPNHIGTGGMPFATSDRPWRTAFGRVDPDAEAVASLTASGPASLAPDVLTYEHSISGIVPVIRWFLPDARIVPVAIRGHTSPAKLRSLATSLGRLMTPGTVVIASVDFSHYRSAGEAARHDADTIRSLRTMDESRILGFGNDNLDSPATITVLLEMMKAAGATRFELLSHANSSEFGGSVAPPNVTSYLCVAYR
jgi:AmmeMemoRadiSam system protein B